MLLFYFLQDYVDVDRVVLASQARIQIDRSLLIKQPTDNDVDKV